MKNYRVEFTKSAQKEFLKLNHTVQEKIVSALNVLSAHPFSELIRTKKIKGAFGLYRVRVGDYRVVYEILNETLKIIVIKVGHRRDVYRGL